MQIRTRLILLLIAAFAAALPSFAQLPAAPVLIAPDGGEQWLEGSNQIVSWKLAGATVPDSIELRLIGSPTLDMRGQVLMTFHRVNPGVWVWHNVRPAGRNYLLEISVFSDGQSVTGTSHKSFVIVSRRPEKTGTIQMSLAEPGQ